MPIIQLRHMSKVASFRPAHSAAVPRAVCKALAQTAALVTFRNLESGKPDLRIRHVNATSRFLQFQADCLLFYGVEGDSPLAPLILWDAAHALPVGGRIGMAADFVDTPFLARDYFAGALQSEAATDDGIRWFTKTALLPAEQDAGLDAWTFGIPVGPEDATPLNKTVERILELDVPTAEILLCGRPGANFKYFDKVRIVGEDIPAPPLRIGEKKNRLAQEARHPNLCIIHDRVFLPRNFHEAVKRFGDFFPLTTMQSLWFDDYHNCVPSRYSDTGVTFSLKTMPVAGLMRDNNVEAPSVLSPSVFPLSDQSGFYTANSLKYSEAAYPTGSMYLCKRSVWNLVPQTHLLHWNEFEDLEQAYRAVAAGVPRKVNPFALTQTLMTRALLNSAKSGVLVEQLKGAPTLRRAWTAVLPLRRKPALKVSQESALRAMQRFVSKYSADREQFQLPSQAVVDSASRFEAIIRILQRAKVPVQQGPLRQFVADFEKLVMFDQVPYSMVDDICRDIVFHKMSAVDALLIKNPLLRRHLTLRPSKGMFYQSLEDYFTKPSLALRLGTLLSALYLYRSRKDLVFLEGGVLAYYRAILQTTPFHSRGSAQKEGA
ncbi:hypothetical protein [Acidovorax sp. M2(2025)]|uniref:hypothetical protein n=1 Tax=Acidovorax sp. M2(2025) TaxID=3411355 RepID=UPI003BF5401A